MDLKFNLWIKIFNPMIYLRIQQYNFNPEIILPQKSQKYHPLNSSNFFGKFLLPVQYL